MLTTKLAILWLLSCNLWSEVIYKIGTEADNLDQVENFHFLVLKFYHKLWQILGQIKFKHCLRPGYFLLWS